MAEIDKATARHNALPKRARPVLVKKSPKGNTLSEFDPFDNAPADEEGQEVAEESVFDAPPADAPAPKKAPAKKVVKAASVGTDEGKIVLTFKEGAGFDSSWTVVHANNVAEANEILADPAFKELLDRSKRVAAYYRGGAAASGGGDRRGVGAAGNNGKPAGAGQAPAWFPPAPGEGWVYKTGLKKDGSGVYHAWAPPRGVDAKWAFHNPPK